MYLCMPNKKNSQLPNAKEVEEEVLILIASSHFNYSGLIFPLNVPAPGLCVCNASLIVKRLPNKTTSLLTAVEPIGCAETHCG